jgi:hypothetical protein
MHMDKWYLINKILKKLYLLLEAKDLDGCYHKAGIFDA